jgi:hypothetical protein
MPSRLRFSIHLSSEEFLLHYQGHAQALIVRAEDGRRVQLPAKNFRRHITAEGLHGRFEVALDDNNKLLSITRLE